MCICCFSSCTLTSVDISTCKRLRSTIRQFQAVFLPAKKSVIFTICGIALSPSKVHDPHFGHALRVYISNIFQHSLVRKGQWLKDKQPTWNCMYMFFFCKRSSSGRWHSLRRWYMVAIFFYRSSLIAGIHHLHPLIQTGTDRVTPTFCVTFVPQNLAFTTGHRWRTQINLETSHGHRWSRL